MEPATGHGGAASPRRRSCEIRQKQERPDRRSSRCSKPSLQPATAGLVQVLWMRKQRERLAPAVGFEPTTNGLTVRCATAAPRRNKPYLSKRLVFKPQCRGSPYGQFRWRGGRHIAWVLAVASALLAPEVQKGLLLFGGTLAMEQPSRSRYAPDGLVAEWLRRGLQILAPRFDSGRGLQ